MIFFFCYFLFTDVSFWQLYFCGTKRDKKAGLGRAIFAAFRVPGKAHFSEKIYIRVNAKNCLL